MEGRLGWIAKSISGRDNPQDVLTSSHSRVRNKSKVELALFLDGLTDRVVAHFKGVFKVTGKTVQIRIKQRKFCFAELSYEC